MEKTPLISVLIPVYNAEKYVERCVKSVLKQTYPNFEVVIVDDGSTDTSYEILQKLAQTDSRIKLFKKENEKNISKTRNFLLKHKSGKYFCFVDSDDEIKRTFIEDLFNSLTKNNADMSSCEFRPQLFAVPILKLITTKKCCYARNYAISEMILGKGIHFVVWNKLYKSDIAENVQFDEDSTFGEDFIFNFEYVKNCKRVSYFNKPLYKYILHSNSMIHEKLSEKQLSFVNALLKLEESEKDEELKKVVEAWLAFTCAYYLFLSKKNKNISEQTKQMLANNVLRNEQILLNNARTRKLYKIAFSFLKSQNKKLLQRT